MKKVETICIIDDDGLYTLLLKKKIEKLNICTRIISYSNGEDAIAGISSLLDSNNLLPDVILLDINMPVMNGWEFMEAFMKLMPNIGKKIAIYLSSSSIAAEDRLRAQENAAIENYLTKPIESEILLKIAQLN